MSTSQSTVTGALEAGLRLVRVLALVFLVVFLASGTTRIQPGEIALVLRMGALRRGGDGEAVHPPGILLGLPQPLDKVIRIPVQQEGEAVLETLWSTPRGSSTSGAIDPLESGYVLTGDQSILRVRARVRYSVEDPVSWALHLVDPEEILRVQGAATLTRVLGSWNVDDALRLQRQIGEEGAAAGVESLGPRLRLELGRRLDAVGSGLRVNAVEIEEILPPEEVLQEFKAVQSARIERATLRRNAEGEAARIVPEAEARRNRLVREAETEKSRRVSEARSQQTRFRELLVEYRRSPELVRFRHRSERLEAALQGSRQVILVPPGKDSLALRLRPSESGGNQVQGLSGEGGMGP